MKDNWILILFGGAILLLGGAIVWLLASSQGAPAAPAVSEAEGPVEKIGAAIDSILTGFESLTARTRA